jgi:hypothetical protein
MFDLTDLAPGKLQAMLAGFLAVCALCLALACWALLERVGRVQAVAQLAAVAAAARACSTAVDHSAQVGSAAIAATAELAAAAARLKVPAQKTVERIETVLRDPTPSGAGCEQAWDVIEKDRKAGAP